MDLSLPNAFKIGVVKGSSRSHLQITEMFIGNGLSITDTDDKGRNGLIIVCEQLKFKLVLKVVKLLVGQGIDRSAKNNKGLTALDLLKRRSGFQPNLVPNHKKIVDLLS